MLQTRIPVLLACALSLAACSTSQHAAKSLAADSSSLGDVAAVSAVSEEGAATREQMICKRVAPTGTRLAKRACMTQSQWEAARTAGQESLEKAQKQGALYDSRPSG